MKSQKIHYLIKFRWANFKPMFIIRSKKTPLGTPIESLNVQTAYPRVMIHHSVPVILYAIEVNSLTIKWSTENVLPEPHDFDTGNETDLKIEATFKSFAENGQPKSFAFFWHRPNPPKKISLMISPLPLPRPLPLNLINPPTFSRLSTTKCPPLPMLVISQLMMLIPCQYET